MTNMALINETVKLVDEYYAAEFVTVDTNSINRNVTDWYTHTDIVDAEILASAVIEFGPYQIISMTALEQLKEYYFPTMPVEFGQFHISEIEEAMEDIFWRN